MIVLYYIAYGFCILLGCFPVKWVAYLGRFVGLLAYIFDSRHRKIAQDNLRLIYGKEFSERKVRALARENYMRIVESYFSAIATLQLTNEQAMKYVTVIGREKMRPQGDPEYGYCRIALIGHFGNFEMYAKVSSLFPGLQFATTYRGMDNKYGERLLEKLRAKSGCLFFERRKDGAALRKAMNSQSLLIGLLADQHPGRHGLWFPFMGVGVRCSASAAVYALRYNAQLIPVFCYRIAPGKWEIKFEDEIPIHINGKQRTVEEVMIDINRAYEQAIRRDPANWFWVHRRWKSRLKKPPTVVTSPVENENQKLNNAT